MKIKYNKLKITSSTPAVFIKNKTLTMHHFMKVIVGLVIITFFSPFAQAQTLVKTSLSTGTTKYYKGRIDDINDVTIALTCNSKVCSGDLTYLRSRDKFKLKGTLDGSQIQLSEFNRTNKCTGYLSGRMEGKVIQLDWKNEAGTIGNTIQLEEVARQPDFPTFCGDNKWINAYSGKINNEAVEIILQRVDNHRVLGTAYYTKTKKKAVINGTLSVDKNLYLNFADEKTSTSLGSLRGIYKPNQNLSVSFYDQQNKQKIVSFQLQKSLDISCLEYADYYTNYDFLFPKSSHAIFNEVMVLLTKDWIEDCRVNVQKIRKKGTKAELRASQRAYSWTDVALLTDNFVSGMLTYHATWGVGEETKTFNYDLTNGEVIELTTIFKKGFNYKQFIKKQVAAEIIKSPIYKRNESYRNWIKNQEFTYFTLGKEGISFYSDFHIIYDRQRIMIPYKKLKANIRKNASVRQLF